MTLPTSILWHWDTVSGDRSNLQKNTTDSTICTSSVDTNTGRHPIRPARYGFGVTGGGGISGMTTAGSATLRWTTSASYWDYTTGMIKALVFKVYCPSGNGAVDYFKSEAAIAAGGLNFELIKDSSGNLKFGVPNALGTGYQYSTLANNAAGWYIFRVKIEQGASNTVITVAEDMGSGISSVFGEKSAATVQTDATVVLGAGSGGVGLGNHATGGVVGYLVCLDGETGWTDSAQLLSYSGNEGIYRLKPYSELVNLHGPKMNKYTLPVSSINSDHDVSLTPHVGPAISSFAQFVHVANPDNAAVREEWVPFGASTVAEALESFDVASGVRARLNNVLTDFTWGAGGVNTSAAVLSATPGLRVQHDGSSLPDNAFMLRFRQRAKFSTDVSFLGYSVPGTYTPIQNIPVLQHNSTVAGGSLCLYNIEENNRDGDPADFEGGARTPSSYHVGQNASSPYQQFSTIIIPGPEPYAVETAIGNLYNNKGDGAWSHTFPEGVATEYFDNNTTLRSSMQFYLPGDVKNKNFSSFFSYVMRGVNATAQGTANAAQIGKYVNIHGVEPDVFAFVPPDFSVNFGHSGLPIADRNVGSIRTTDATLMAYLTDVSAKGAITFAGDLPAFWQIPVKGHDIMPFEDDASGFGLRMDADGHLFVSIAWNAANYILVRADDPIELGRAFSFYFSVEITGTGEARGRLSLKYADEGPISNDDTVPVTILADTNFTGTGNFALPVVLDPCLAINDSNTDETDTIFTSTAALNGLVSGDWSNGTGANSGAFSAKWLGIALSATPPSNNALTPSTDLYFGCLLVAVEGGGLFERWDIDGFNTAVTWTSVNGFNPYSVSAIAIAPSVSVLTPPSLPARNVKHIYAFGSNGLKDLASANKQDMTEVAVANALTFEAGALTGLPPYSGKVITASSAANYAKTPNVVIEELQGYLASDKAVWAMLGFQKTGAFDSNTLVEVLLSMGLVGTGGMWRVTKVTGASATPNALATSLWVTTSTLNAVQHVPFDVAGIEDGNTVLLLTQYEPISEDPICALGSSGRQYNVRLHLITPTLRASYMHFGSLTILGTGAASPRSTVGTTGATFGAGLFDQNGGSRFPCLDYKGGLLLFGVRDEAHGFDTSEAMAILEDFGAGLVSTRKGAFWLSLWMNLFGEE